jgi:hypothetical protein
MFLRGKSVEVLCLVKPKNDLKRHMQVELSMQTERSTPRSRALCDPIELAEKSLARFTVLHGLIPRLFNHFFESRHFGLIVFKFERSWFLGSSGASKKKRAMVGEGWWERVKDVIVKSNVALMVAKDGVELAQGRI